MQQQFVVINIESMKTEAHLAEPLPSIILNSADSPAELRMMDEPDSNVAQLKRKIKNLERDLKNARHRITKLKNQKKKLLQQTKPSKSTKVGPKSPLFFTRTGV